MPINPKTGKAAKSNGTSTWATFDEAKAALGQGGYDGLMFALHPDDGLVFVDLDDCRNPNNKTLKKWAELIIRHLNSYTEVSPSGTGVHVLLRGKKPGERCRKGSIECYDHKRFATVTGRRLLRFSGRVEDRQSELEEFYTRHLAEAGGSVSHPAGDHAVPSVPSVPEKKLAKLLENAKAKAVYEGTWNGYASQSEADMALANLAARRGWSEGETSDLLRTARRNAGADGKHDGYYALTFRRARGDFHPTDLSEARRTFRKWVSLQDDTILDVLLAVIASSHLPADPCWLHIVGPPSTGKTEGIRAVETWPCVYALTELTPAGLVSGRDSEDGVDHSLMPKLHCKTLCIKDFTPTIDLPPEHRSRLFALLRDAFDGSTARHTAMVGTRRHEATFNCITGVTNAIEKIWRNTSLGERYLLYRHPTADPVKSASRALEKATAKVEMREQLKRAACGVLAGVNQEVVPEYTPEVKSTLIKLAVLLATVRTFVERDRQHNVEILPEPEGPSRIVQQLFKLGQGLALINGRTEVDRRDLPVLTRVAFDSMPLLRRKLLEALNAVPAGKRAKVNSITQGIGLERTATARHLRDMVLLKVCDRQQEKANVITYALTAEFRELLVLGTAGTARHGPQGEHARQSSRKRVVSRSSP